MFQWQLLELCNHIHRLLGVMRIFCVNMHMCIFYDENRIFIITLLSKVVLLSNDFLQFLLSRNQLGNITHEARRVNYLLSAAESCLSVRAESLLQRCHHMTLSYL